VSLRLGCCFHLTLDSEVYISFGGLLLYIEGPYKKLTPLRIDHIYLLLKK
jgi:RNA polymerase Rpb8